MTKKDFETFMYIGAEKKSICVFSKIDSKILYKKEFKYIKLKNYIEENKIITFLSENIFQIEKKLNQFINDINLIIDSNQFHFINISTKQNIYGQVQKKDQINILNDLKNYIHENYINYSIIHYVVNYYLIDNEFKKSFDFSKKCNHFCVDTTFILLDKQDVFFYRKIFEKFQILVKKIMCGKYIFNSLDSNKFNECEMGLKHLSGYNPNEVFLIKKSAQKYGFFERFFHLLS